VELKPHATNAGEYVLKVTNAGPNPAARVRVQLFFAGSVQDTGGGSCFVPSLSKPGDAICNFTSLGLGTPVQQTFRVVDASDPVHTAVVYHAYDYSPGVPRDPDWSQNIYVHEGTPSAEVRGIEVTQGIQNLHGEVDLIEGRKTWVRVHARTTSGVLNNVTARLHAIDFDANRSAVFTPSNAGNNAPPGYVDLKTAPTRLADEYTFLFELPSEWWKGSVLFRAEIDSVAYSCIDQGNDCEAPALFREGPKIHLQLLGMLWTDSNGVVHRPTRADMHKVVTQVQGLHPVVDVKWAWTYDLQHRGIPQGSPGSSTTSMYRLLSMVITDSFVNGCAPSLSDECISVGVIVDPPIGDVMYGIAVRDGDSALGYLERDLQTIAHETGHTLGRRHVACNGTEANPDPAYPYPGGQMGIGSLALEESPEAFWGTDVYGVRKSWGVLGSYMRAHETGDLMSYCNPAWTGPYTWGHLRTALENRFGTSPLQTSSVTPAATSTPAIVVTGLTSTTLADNAIDTVDHVASAETSPGSGTHSIKLLDGTGAVLEEAAFTPEPYQDTPEAGFALALPWDPAGVKIALYNGATELDAVEASANAPTVSVIAPNGGQSFSGSSVTLTWTATDADAEPLTYRVHYSPDGGASWLPVATQLEQTSLTIPRSKLKGSADALFRVTANDGFREGVDASDATFTVAGNAPTLSLSRALDHRVFVGGQTVSFEALAYDTEDESLPDSAYGWTADGTHDLGSGQHAAFNVSELGSGSHTIQVNVTDTDGQTATAKVHINVFSSVSSIPRCGGALATRIGTSAADVMTARAGEVLLGGGGSDRLTGVSAKDILCGGSGNDQLSGVGGSDLLFGDAGNDTVTGSSGNDRLTGGSGRDRLMGGTGNDLHVGSSGRDRCVGGPGRDRFKSCESVRR
jgi:Ca2+-binding RTX toxin-like protein